MLIGRTAKLKCQVYWQGWKLILVKDVLELGVKIKNSNIPILKSKENNMFEL